MITLHTFGPAFGLPDPSPFVMKAMILLKMSDLPYDTAFANVQKAPKRKGPYLRDGDEVIPDSTFIRFHLEDKYGIDFDKNLTDEQKAIAWAFEKLCEDNLYFAILHNRWVNDENFKRGPAMFFERVPALLRPLIIRKVRNAQKNINLYGQGMGRHSEEEIGRLAGKAIKSISDYLGDKPFLMGEQPCGADASVFSHVAGTLCPVFESKTREHAQSYDNLKKYSDRCMALWFPDFDKKT